MDHFSRIVSDLDMGQFFFGLFWSIHRLHNFSDIVFFILLPSMIRRLKYDDIEKSDDRHDDEREEKCDLGTGGEEHGEESIEYGVLRI
jgi:hypothetical protein